MSARGWKNQSILAFCRLGVAGLSPVMPGTCGTLVAALIAPWVFLPLPLVLRVAVLGALFVLGALAATRAERLIGRKDPGQVVIDELVGLWITLLPLTDPSFARIAWAVVLFRVFDMAKPWPVRASETWLPDGYGVMLDDVVAGVLALCVLQGLMALGWA